MKKSFVTACLLCALPLSFGLTACDGGKSYALTVNGGDCLLACAHGAKLQ